MASTQRRFRWRFTAAPDAQCWADKALMMNLMIQRVGVEQEGQVRRSMSLAFEEYRGRRVLPSGALTERIEAVRTAVSRGGAFLTCVDEVAVGRARSRLVQDPAYADWIAVLPEFRGGGVAGALMAAFEEVLQALGVPEACVGVTANLPHAIFMIFITCAVFVVYLS